MTENNKKELTLSRDCSAVLIPHGMQITLIKDEKVTIMQQLGGSFTAYYNGNLVRIEGSDADAIGLEVPKDAVGSNSTLSAQEGDKNNTILKNKQLVGNGIANEQEVWDALKTCYDPEIPVNIVDLGLIYECDVVPLEEDDIKNNSLFNRIADKISEVFNKCELSYKYGSKVIIKMTLTAPGCGMGPYIVEDVRSKLLDVVNVMSVDIELVWEPVWNQDMMSEEAQLTLGLL